MNNHQVIFLSHGGGPMPLLGDKAHLEMVDCLKTISNKINKPSEKQGQTTFNIA